MTSVTVAVCTGMRQNLQPLLKSLTITDCDEILIVGTQGRSFPKNEFYGDPRIRLLYAHSHYQSYKRKLALENSSCDVLAFIDDDALPSLNWISGIRCAFTDAATGILTGPSLLSTSPTLWKRTAQLAMASSQYSRRRYYPCQAGYVEWYDIIGANMAFRRAALEATGITPKAFPSHGEEMIMSYQVVQSGWKIFYDPGVFVIHEPHEFARQVRQIYLWGRAEMRLKRAGVLYPKRDAAFLWYIPTLILFALSYSLGECIEVLLKDYDMKFIRMIKTLGISHLAASRRQKQAADERNEKQDT